MLQKYLSSNTPEPSSRCLCELNKTIKPPVLWKSAWTPGHIYRTKLVFVARLSVWCTDAHSVLRVLIVLTCQLSPKPSRSFHSFTPEVSPTQPLCSLLLLSFWTLLYSGIYLKHHCPRETFSKSTCLNIFLGFTSYQYIVRTNGPHLTSLCFKVLWFRDSHYNAYIFFVLYQIFVWD